MTHSSMPLSLTLSERFAKICEYFEYPFVRHALIVSVLIAICAAILGVFLVLRRYSALGDGLSHVAFGAAALAATLGVFDTQLVLPVTVIAAIFILRLSPDKRASGDAVIAAVSVGALAIGYTVLSLGGGESNLGGDVCTALFGSSAILSVDTLEVIFVLAMTLILAALAVIYRYKLLSVTFDERFAKATGTKTGVYDTAIAVVCALVIVVGMKLAGALLISALALFPALSAMKLTRSFSRVLLISSVVGALSAAAGVLLSILLETPVGATIAAVDIIIYLIVSLVKIKK
ncbi:MAG: metal ABC transporter permease [Eubacteriales bacterium]